MAADMAVESNLEVDMLHEQLTARVGTVTETDAGIINMFQWDFDSDALIFLDLAKQTTFENNKLKTIFCFDIEQAHTMLQPKFILRTRDERTRFSSVARFARFKNKFDGDVIIFNERLLGKLSTLISFMTMEMEMPVIFLDDQRSIPQSQDTVILDPKLWWGVIASLRTP